MIETYLTLVDPTGALTLAIFAVSCFVGLIVTGGAWLIQSLFLRCKISKVIDYASRQGLTIAAIFKSNHVTKLIPCKVHPNGYLETLSKNKKDPKHYIPILRTSFSMGSATSDLSELPKEQKDEIEAESKTQIGEAQQIATMEKEILAPSYLEGSSCPVYFVYDGVAVAVTAEALLALGLPTNSYTVNMGKFKGKDNVEKQIKINMVFPLNPQLPKKFLTKLYDQSTVDGYGQDKFQEGWLSRGKSMDGSNVKMLFLAGFGLIICGAALMVAAFFL